MVFQDPQIGSMLVGGRLPSFSEGKPKRHRPMFTNTSAHVHHKACHKIRTQSENQVVGLPRDEYLLIPFVGDEKVTSSELQHQQNRGETN